LSVSWEKQCDLLCSYFVQACLFDEKNKDQGRSTFCVRMKESMMDKLLLLLSKKFEKLNGALAFHYP